MSCLQFYNSFLTDPNLLANGHTLIHNYLLQSPNHRSDTLLNLLVPSPPILALVGNVYPCSVYPVLQDEEKDKTRVYLMELLFKVVGKGGAKTKECQSLLALISRIHNEEGYEKWLGLYAELIKNVPAQQFAPLITSVLQSADNRISTLSVNIFTFVIQSVQNQSLAHVSTEQLFEILYHSVRTFSHLTGTDDHTLETYFVPNQKWLMQFVWGHIEDSPICMKYGFKLLTILYGDMGRFGEAEPEHVDKLFQYGTKLLQEYLKLAADPTFTTAIEEEEEQENTASLPANLPLILYQLLELHDLVLQKTEEEQEEEQDKTDTIPVLIFALLVTIPTASDLQVWINSTDQYVVSIEDEYERSLRNRANALLVTMLEDSDRKKFYAALMKEYFGVIAGAQAVGTVEQWVNSKNSTKIPLTLPSDFLLVEQSSFFILSSTIGSLYSAEQRKELQLYLLNRSQKASSTLIKIVTLYISINEIKQPHQQTVVNFIIGMIRNDGAVYARKEDIGLAIVLARGLGKLAAGTEVVLGTAVPVQFIGLLVSYIRENRNGKPDEDGTYIVLQLLLKLTESSAQNKNVLASIITAELEIFMINNYMHDGLLASIVLKLLELYPHQAMVSSLANSLLAGHIKEEKYCELIAKWLKSSILTLTPAHIELILQLYRPPSHTLIGPILKLYLGEAAHNPSQLTPTIRELLNRDIDPVLLVPMLKCGALQNLEGRLVDTARNIAYEETSQYEIERKLMLVFYCGIYETAKLVTLLGQSDGKLYTDFIEKVLAYSRLFNGQNLRIVTSILFLKLAEVDPSLVPKTIRLLSAYGSPETNEWEEEEEDGEQEEEDIIEKLLNYKLENDELEKQLSEVFHDLLNGGSGAEYIRGKMAQLAP